MTEKTLITFTRTGIVLDDAGKFAVAELRVRDGIDRRRLWLHVWPCRDMPRPPPDVRWFSIRKFHAALDPRGGAIDASGVRHHDIDTWFLKMARLGAALPDLPRESPPR